MLSKRPKNNFPVWEGGRPIFARGKIGLPFAQVLSAERIQRIFAKHGNRFGMSAVYSTVVTLWAFLGQVLRDGKEASCQSAVAAAIVS